MPQFPQKAPKTQLSPPPPDRHLTLFSPPDPSGVTIGRDMLAPRILLLFGGTPNTELLVLQKYQATCPGATPKPGPHFPKSNQEILADFFSKSIRPSRPCFPEETS